MINRFHSIKCLTFLSALCLAATAFASNILFVNDLRLGQSQEGSSAANVVLTENNPCDINFYIDSVAITGDDFGQYITIPVKATFGGDISAWDVEFIFPEGLTPTRIMRGDDMKLHVIGDDGTEYSEYAYSASNGDCTHIVAGPSLYPNYRLDEDGYYELYGSNRWNAGNYNEMFLLTVLVDQSFQGGEVTINAKATCGRDIDNDAFYPVTMDYDGNGYYPGDVNSDGMVDVADNTCYLNYLVADEDDLFDVEAADVHKDNVIDVLDMTKVFDYLLFGEWFEEYVLSESESTASFTIVYGEPVYSGDVNGDGENNISDVTILIDYLLGSLSASDIYIDNADVNCDGNVDISDVTALIDMLLN